MNTEKTQENPTLWAIFLGQSKFNTIPGTTDMLEDYAARAVVKRAIEINKAEKHGGTKWEPFSYSDISYHIGKYYNQCREICDRKLERGKVTAREFLSKLGIKFPEDQQQ